MNQIFLDNQSTTPPDPEVVKEMIHFFSHKFGNASSIDHSIGWKAKEALSYSRKKIASMISAQPEQIILTSGATESINLALRGLKKPKKNCNSNIITFQSEHRAVLDTCEAISKKGLKIKYLGVDKHGYIDLNQLEKNIDNQTIAISVLHGNNEIGTIQDINRISKIVSDKDITLHIDASQSAGKIPIDINNLGSCLISFTSHKLYGPQGIGALYISDDLKSFITPQITGGGHELGIRSGTIPIALACGFGKACELANKLMQDDRKRLDSLTNLLEKNLRTIFPDMNINGPTTNRLPGNLNVKLPKINNRAFIMKIPEIAISRGSACSTSTEKKSHVLKAIGLNDNEIDSSIRFGIGRFNNTKQINKVSEIIKSRYGA